MLVRMWWESETEDGQKASERKHEKEKAKAELPDDMPDNVREMFSG